MSEMNTNAVPNSVHRNNVLSGLRGAYQWGHLCTVKMSLVISGVLTIWGAPAYSGNVLSGQRGAYQWGGTCVQ